MSESQKSAKTEAKLDFPALDQSGEHFLHVGLPHLVVASLLPNEMCKQSNSVHSTSLHYRLLVTFLAFILRIINEPESYQTLEAHSTAENYLGICRQPCRIYGLHLTQALQHTPLNIKPTARSQSTQDVPPMDRFLSLLRRSNQTQPWHESSSVSHCTGYTGQCRAR